MLQKTCAKKSPLTLLQGLPKHRPHQPQLRGNDFS